MTQAPLELAERVIALLEQARARLVRSVNSGMMITYWSIGREIVQALQGGEERAEYGKEVINTLSQQLTERYGKGYSAQTLWNFRQFYLTYPDRLEILSPSGRELIPLANLSLSGRDLQTTGIEPALRQGFSPQLTWSHYRALMRVQSIQAREFYEREAAECGWSKQQLERQIQTAYYERILANQGEQGLVSQERERLPGDAMEPIHLLKSPMVLEFLDLPDTPPVFMKVTSNRPLSTICKHFCWNSERAFLLSPARSLSASTMMNSMSIWFFTISSSSVSC